MKLQLRFALKRSARYARTALGASLILLASKLTYGAVRGASAYFDESHTEVDAGQSGREIGDRRRRHEEENVNERLDEIKKMAETAVTGGVSTGEPVDAAPRARHLLVDLGPLRSEVYVGGRRVGQTPYAGQVTCADGDAIKVQVVPPEGMPLERQLTCGGSHIEASE